MTWIQQLQCAFHRAYHWVRTHLRIARWKLLRESAVVTGTIVEIQGQQPDGDWTFDLVTADGVAYHCETDACYPEAWDVRRRLAVGACIEIEGREVIDPPHLREPERLEIHPTRRIVISS
jgi:hypothetical protein